MPVYKDQKGRWRYRFALHGKRYSGSTPKGGNTSKIAKRLEQEHVEKVQSRTYTGEIPKISALVEKFLDYQRARTTKTLSIETQATRLRFHVVPEVGSMSVDRLRKEHIDTMVTKWSTDGAAPRSINNRLASLRTMLTLAVEWDYIASVPRISNVKVPPDTMRFLTDEESTRLLASAKPRWHSMILVGLRTGLRIGELRGLQWDDIHFEQGYILVRRTEPGRRDHVATAPKGNRERAVPLTDDALEALLDVRSGLKRPSEWVWPAGVRRGPVDKPRSDGGCYRAIKLIFERSEIDGYEDLAWHTLRHTFASQMVMRGKLLAVVQVLMGHSSSRQTERYAHLAPGFIDRSSVAGLDFALAPCQEPAKALPSGEK